MALKADLVIRSSRVFTGLPGEDGARELAIAIAGDRIVATGDPADITASAPASTPVCDLGDALVCPGFHDAHLHFFHTALGSSPYMLMEMGRSEEDLVAKTRRFAASLPDDAWVVTQGWRDYRWDPPIPPTKRSLDEAFPNRPCAMYSGDGHTMWLNSRALDLMGITRDSVPPEGGSYDKDEAGELTGIVREAAAMQLLPRMLEWISSDRIERVYADQMARMAAEGITSICDMSLMPLPGLDFIRDDVYEALEARGALTLRAHLFPTLLDDQSRLEGMQERYRESSLLRAPGFKQFFDGVSSQHTAYLTEPYANPRFTGDRGRLTVSKERMRTMVLAAASRGHAVRIHTIGDGAIHAALDIFEEARRRFGAPAQGRNTLEHLENLLPEDIARLRELDVLASSQPCHITLDPGGPERDLGLDRSKIMWPFATYLARGVDQAFGTDSPITPVTSMDVLYTAVTRRDPSSHWPEGGWLPSECISIADALRIYTAGGAAAAGRQGELGRIAPGMLADLVALDCDITACDPEEIQSARVLVTYVGGRLVFER
ncbi:MAG: amidohydrolase [Collinsella sp.]|nr:amidohydrolase [Collinsella sp.]